MEALALAQKLGTRGDPPKELLLVRWLAESLSGLGAALLEVVELPQDLHSRARELAASQVFHTSFLLSLP